MVEQHYNGTHTGNEATSDDHEPELEVQNQPFHYDFVSFDDISYTTPSFSDEQIADYEEAAAQEGLHGC